MKEVIDLLSDSDDDAKPPAAAVEATTEQSSRRDAYDSDESLMNSKPVFSKKSASTPLVKSPPSHATTMSATAEEDDAPIQYPPLLANTRRYEDLRPKLILALWQCARNRVQHSYDAAKLDQLARDIVLLSLIPYPIRSLEEYCFNKGVGGSCGASSALKTAKLDRVQSELVEGGFETRVIRKPPPNQAKQYTSIAEACLVAMLAEIDRRLAQKDTDPQVLNAMDDVSLKDVLSEKDLWISVQDLIPAVDALLKPECPGRLTRAGDEDNGAAHYNLTSTKSVEFLQIRKLETTHKELGDYEVARIKKHTRRGKLLYELTHVGFQSARMIRERQFPLPPGYYRTSRIQRMSQVPESCRDVCIGVDSREGGGGKRALHDMCNRLESKNVPFFVANFPIGDYLFFTRGPSGNLDYLCPILVERKAVEDVAMSIHDGRWQTQKQRMYAGQYVFGYENSRMVFIIEGNIKRHELTGGYVGSLSYGLKSEYIKNEIANLESEGFTVLKTTSREQTMFELTRQAMKVADDLKSGKLTAQYTYAEFNEALKKVSRDQDFSLLAKAAVDRRAQASVAAAASKRAHAELDYDSEIEVLEGKPAAFDNPTGRRTLLTDFMKPVASASSAKKAKRADKYSGLLVKQLKEKCEECGLSQSGNKEALIARLNGPHPPELWLRRKRAGEYVPTKHDGAGAALLVALYLHEKATGNANRGMTKDELIARADELQISTTPILARSAGPHAYTGWSSMGSLRNTDGDPPLVKLKRGRFSLTHNSDLAGYPIAEAMHKWCHEFGNCQCGATDV